MISSNLIKPNLPVVGSDNVQCAVVDHMEDRDTIRLNKDEKGEHHFIPLAWVESVDDKVHLSRTGDEVKRQWQNRPKV
ncbi:MAG: DUF2171 domain-containing protein [Myxococcaceae bacterium]|nr:DUF2171 domain-containing protein [Myxococcaceae bacterium]